MSKKIDLVLMALFLGTALPFLAAQDGQAQVEAPAARSRLSRVLVLSAAYDVGIPAGPWASVYSLSPAGLGLSADWYFTNRERPAAGAKLAFAAGLTMDLSGFSRSSDAEHAASTLTAFSLSAHPLAACAWRSLELSLYPGFGLDWATLAADEGAATVTKATYDFVFECGLRAQYQPSDRLGLGAAVEYRHYFFTKALDYVGLAVGASITP